MSCGLLSHASSWIHLTPQRAAPHCPHHRAGRAERSRQGEGGGCRRRGIACVGMFTCTEKQGLMVLVTALHPIYRMEDISGARPNGSTLFSLSESRSAFIIMPRASGSAEGWSSLLHQEPLTASIPFHHLPLSHNS